MLQPEGSSLVGRETVDSLAVTPDMPDTVRRPAHGRLPDVRPARARRGPGADLDARADARAGPVPRGGRLRRHRRRAGAGGGGPPGPARRAAAPARGPRRGAVECRGGPRRGLPGSCSPKGTVWRTPAASMRSPGGSRRARPSRAGNFDVGHDTSFLHGRLSQRWFDMIHARWREPGEWPRVSRSGFAIRADVFQAVGGFEPEYGQFAPPLLPRGCTREGSGSGPSPAPASFTSTTREMRRSPCRHRRLRARRARRACAQRPGVLRALLRPRRRRGRTSCVTSAPSRAPWPAPSSRRPWPIPGARPSSPGSCRRSRSTWPSGTGAAGGARTASPSPSTSSRWSGLPCPAGWRWARYLRAHARVIRQTQLEWLARQPPLPPARRTPGRCDGRSTRPGCASSACTRSRSIADGPSAGRSRSCWCAWRRPGEHELRIETGGIRGDPLDGRWSRSSPAGASLPRELVDQRRRGRLSSCGCRRPGRRPRDTDSSSSAHH